MLDTFAPYYGQTFSVAATTTSANTATLNTAAKSVRIVNTGTVAVHFRIGEASQTATTSDPVVGPSSSIVVMKPEGHGNIAIRTNTGTATVFVTPGDYGL